LDTAPNPQSTGRGQHSSKPPIANEFALGYTYQDVLDTDHEDILARLSIYTLAKPSPQFLPLLKPLFTPTTIPNMLLVILLDWSEPWKWIQQLRAWVRLLISLLQTMPGEDMDALQENTVEWRDRKRNAANGSSTPGGAVSSVDEAALPLGDGEWDLPLGGPLCVVCQNSNKIEALEKESGWKDRHFDFVQQYLRTVLLKHGGSLIYTMPHLSGSTGTTTLQTLIHTSLGIHSMLQSQSQRTVMATALKYNTTDRDHILIPPNFDSWGKIRILTDHFEVKKISEAWAKDLGTPISEDDGESQVTGDSVVRVNGHAEEDESILLYKELITAPEDKYDGLSLPSLKASNGDKKGLEVESKDLQTFLAEQAVVVDQFGKEDDKVKVKASAQKKNLGPGNAGDVEEHIGRVQFNLGGIQMDAEDVMKRLKVWICITLPKVSTDSHRTEKPIAR
jgi:dynein light intermediate chain 1